MRYEIASAKKRLAAFLLDSTVNLAVLIFSISYGSSIGRSMGWVVLGLSIALLTTKMSYWSVGTSLGKSYLGLQVVDHNTFEPLRFQKMLIRQTFGMLVSFSVLNIGFIWVAIDRERQGWHDKILNDIVIDLNRPVTDVDDDEFVQGY